MTFFPNKLYSNSIHVEHKNYYEKKKNVFLQQNWSGTQGASVAMYLYSTKKNKKEIFEPRSMKKKIKKLSNKEIGREFMQI